MLRARSPRRGQITRNAGGNHRAPQAFAGSESSTPGIDTGNPKVRRAYRCSGTTALFGKRPRRVGCCCESRLSPIRLWTEAIWGSLSRKSAWIALQHDHLLPHRRGEAAIEIDFAGLEVMAEGMGFEPTNGVYPH